MTMKLTFGDLQQSFEPLTKFGQTEGLEPKVAVRVAKTLKAVQAAFDGMTARAEHIKKDVEVQFSKVTDQTKVEALKLAAMKEKLALLYDEVFEIPAKPIKMSTLGNKLPVPGHILALDWFFEDDISDTDTETPSVGTA